jgi:hypothetical protein
VVEAESERTGVRLSAASRKRLFKLSIAWALLIGAIGIAERMAEQIDSTAVVPYIFGLTYAAVLLLGFAAIVNWGTLRREDEENKRIEVASWKLQSLKRSLLSIKNHRNN